MHMTNYIIVHVHRTHVPRELDGLNPGRALDLGLGAKLVLAQTLLFVVEHEAKLKEHNTAMHVTT